MTHLHKNNGDEPPKKRNHASKAHLLLLCTAPLPGLVSFAVVHFRNGNGERQTTSDTHDGRWRVDWIVLDSVLPLLVLHSQDVPLFYHQGRLWPTMEVDSVFKGRQCCCTTTTRSDRKVICLLEHPPPLPRLLSLCFFFVFVSPPHKCQSLPYENNCLDQEDIASKEHLGGTLTAKYVEQKGRTCNHKEEVQQAYIEIALNERELGGKIIRERKCKKVDVIVREHNRRGW